MSYIDKVIDEILTIHEELNLKVTPESFCEILIKRAVSLTNEKSWVNKKKIDFNDKDVQQ